MSIQTTRNFAYLLFIFVTFSILVNETHAATNYNLGAFSTRLITVNIPETDDVLTTTDVAEAKDVINVVKPFITTSSYGKTTFSYTAQGIFQLASGTCSKDTYGDQVNALIQLSLEASDKQKPFKNFDHFLIFHPQPNCSSENWSAEGYGKFKAYKLNGRTVQLRGVRTPSMDVSILKHEIGHSFGHQTAIGHPDYWLCKISQTNAKVVTIDTNNCQSKFDFENRIVPAYDIMSDPYTQYDYGAITKEAIGWIGSKEKRVATTTGSYKIVPFKQKSGVKTLVIPVGQKMNLYLSLRDGIPDEGLASGISAEIKQNSISRFLPVSNKNYDAPLVVGTTYKIGNKNIRVDTVTSSGATITILP